MARSKIDPLKVDGRKLSIHFSIFYSKTNEDLKMTDAF